MRIIKLTLPHYEYRVAQFLQLQALSFVANPVCGQLRGPKLRIRLRDGSLRAACVCMPKATVYEERPTLPLVREVRPAGEITRAEPVPKSCRVKRPTDGKLRGRVPPAHAAHALMHVQGHIGNVAPAVAVVQVGEVPRQLFELYLVWSRAKRMTSIAASVLGRAAHDRNFCRGCSLLRRAGHVDGTQQHRQAYTPGPNEPVGTRDAWRSECA